MTQNISFNDFLKAPIDEIRSFIPPTVIFAAGGTRRAAALSGITMDEYAEWTVPLMLETCSRFYNLGVQHLITPVTRPNMFQEMGYYGDNFIVWMESLLGGRETLHYYHNHNWQVRLVIAASSQNQDERVQRLRQLAQKIDDATQIASKSEENIKYLWYTVVPDYDDLVQWILEGVRSIEGQADQSIIQKALYQVSFPLSEILISFGKPILSHDILPPFCWNNINAYWTQRPGYLLDDEVLRRIFYDFAFLRQTYRHDKTGREQNALDHPAFWLEGPTIGLGIQVGSFWYPAPFSLPDNDHRDSDNNELAPDNEDDNSDEDESDSTNDITN